VRLGIAALVLLLMLTSAACAQNGCIDAEMRDHVRDLMMKGLDRAMERHTQKVFDTWMRDPSGQPARAASGVRQAVRAYVGSRAALAAWSPKLCGKKP
jgi:hypothetical protein